MTSKMVDDLVQTVTYYNPRNVLLHGYLAPFFVLQAIVYYSFTTDTSSSSSLEDISSTDKSNVTTGIDNDDENRHFYENWVIAVTISIAAQVITYLFCHWSVNVKCWLTYSQVKDPYHATFVKVEPTPNNGSTELIPLVRENFSKRSHIWFSFQKTKYFFDQDTQEFKAADFPCEKPISYFKYWNGYSDPNEMQFVERFYGRNELEMVIPTFKELFKERAMAPFFLFQIFCVCLWCLDEYWYYAVLTLFMLVTFEMILVKHQLRNMQEIRRMGNQPYSVQVFRQSKWKQIRSDQLVPGDLISIVRSNHNVPCDILLIKGSCIVDESTLTGESIPQMKESIEDLDDEERLLDVDQDKLHIIHGGTKVLQHTSGNKEQGCVGYVLKASFNTSQGKLLRTILFGVKRVTANNFETLCFILFLLIFAVISAAYVWNRGIQDQKRSRYRLFFECTVIITSVVPPELPIELSLAVNTSLLSLSKLYIYCTEPFRIPFAGKVEYCCFDKTGTLTSDDLIVEGVAGLKGKISDKSEENEMNNKSTLKKSSNIQTSLANHERVTAISECPNETLQVLASCHSLAHLDDGLVGDPLEKKVLEAIDWNYMKSGIVSPKKGRSPPLKIHQRFHFNSTIKRMSVIVSHKLDMSHESNHIVVAKGAPEFMKPLMTQLPEDYDEVYLEMSTLGARVLALARKDLGQLSHQDLAELKRENVEKDLKFAGFVLISCPLKLDSKAVCVELAQSGHRLVMITGDGALTACHVGRMLEFVQSKQILILSSKDDEWVWQSTPNGLEVPFAEGYDLFRNKNLDLCLTGDSLNYVLNQKDIPSYELIKRVKIFARVSPKQKENVITTLKSHGHSVLMCGDGTNDVGALKHADVGVALLTTTQVENANAAAKTLQQDMKAVLANSMPSTSKQVSTATSTNKKGVKSNKKPVLTPEELRREKVIEAQNKLKEILAEQEQPTFVKLGDASIAAPFTSRLSSTKCICHIIKQGRCTLVTTLQMFKILALNALLSAYCHSVLYIDGIKFSDGQVTIQGLLSTLCFLFISRSQPLKKLSAQRPLPSIFNLYTILTVTLQFCVHFGSLIFLYEEAKTLQEVIDRQNSLEEVVTEKSVDSNTENVLKNDTNTTANTGGFGFDVHTEFKPSIVNSTIFIIWMSLQVATFMVNYKGHPFMQDFRDNKPLCYSFIGSVIFVFTCVTGFMPTLMEQLSVVPFPLEFQHKFLIVIWVDFILALVIDRVCDYFFGKQYLKPL